MTKSSTIHTVAILASALALSLTINNPAVAVTFDWATIGDVGNAGDNGGSLGSVDYEFRISKTEVTNAQYVEFLNAVAATDAYGLYKTDMGSTTLGGIVRNGISGSYTYAVKSDAIGQGPGGSDYGYANKPVNFISWYDAVRFTNWLTSGTTESGTYAITGGGPNSGSVSVPDHATLGAGKFFLPSKDEWYKAAYYDGTGGVYYNYATGSDITPDNNLPSADSGNSVNYYDLAATHTTGDPNYPLTDVGSYLLSSSPYGTFDQNGSLWEWTDTVGSTSGSIQGGSWYYHPLGGSSSILDREWDTFGFRVAQSAVPEPSTYAMAGLGLVALGGISLRRRQRQRKKVN